MPWFLSISHINSGVCIFGIKRNEVSKSLFLAFWGLFMNPDGSFVSLNVGCLLERMRGCPINATLPQAYYHHSSRDMDGKCEPQTCLISDTTTHMLWTTSKPLFVCLLDCNIPPWLNKIKSRYFTVLQHSAASVHLDPSEIRPHLSQL